MRWVLGESKASELRGESMQDVIFNGTTSRKPASRSSVELVFDNSDRAGGQWNQFAEISVKRVLTREGGSYYINSQPVRRRDVQDVFLWYRPWAARLRHHRTGNDFPHHRKPARRVGSSLEETAGVSKYKERRAKPKPPGRHARESDPRGRHPARTQRQPRKTGCRLRVAQNTRRCRTPDRAVCTS